MRGDRSLTVPLTGNRERFLPAGRYNGEVKLLAAGIALALVLLWAFAARRPQ